MLHTTVSSSGEGRLALKQNPRTTSLALRHISHLCSLETERGSWDFFPLETCELPKHVTSGINGNICFFPHEMKIFPQTTQNEKYQFKTSIHLNEDVYNLCVCVFLFRIGEFKDQKSELRFSLKKGKSCASTKLGSMALGLSPPLSSL